MRLAITPGAGAQGSGARCRSRMQLMPVRMKVRVANFLCSDWMGRLLAIALKDRIPFRGIKIDTADPNFSPGVKARLFWRVYESAECRFVQRHLQGTQFVIELGSSLGVISSHLATVMRDGGRLVCVEANPALRPTIERAVARIQQNKRLGVEIIQAAIVADPTQENAALMLGDETFSSTIQPPAAPVSESISVPAITLSEVVQQSDFPEYVLVSDIEGAEASFILSDNNALHLCRKMVIELHDANVGGRQIRHGDLLNSLTAMGFRVIERTGPVVVLEQRQALVS